MGKIEICIGLICLVIAWSNRSVSGGVVDPSLAKAIYLGSNNSFNGLDELAEGLGSPERGERSVKFKTEDYEKVIRIATKEIGVVERIGENDSERIRRYLDYCHIKTPAPYCAAFLSFCFGQAGYKQPRTAWSPALFPKARLVKEPEPGIVYGIYFANMGRIAHCGLIEFVRNELVYGIEGNTNLAGSREGDGVWRKIRHKRTIYRYADWLKE